jgi:hypothetical protein
MAHGAFNPFLRGIRGPRSSFVLNFFWSSVAPVVHPIALRNTRQRTAWSTTTGAAERAFADLIALYPKAMV